MSDGSKDAPAGSLEDGGGPPPAPLKAFEEPDGRIERILAETRQLSDDLTEWVNLRVRLVQFDIQDRIDEELDLMFSGAIVIAMFIVASVMASLGFALVLGDVLDDLSYGFGIMAVFYIVVAGVVTRLRPRLASSFRSKRRKEELDRAKKMTNKE